VYATERVQVETKVFHRNCFRCDHCKGLLKLGSYAALDGKYFCKPHFKQLFALKGNYNEGFGSDKHSKLWIQNAPTKDVIEAARHEIATPVVSAAHVSDEAATQHAHDEASDVKASVKNVAQLLGATTEEIVSAELLFKTYDADGSGDIDKAELIKLLKDLFADHAPTDLDAMQEQYFTEADTDKNGKIDDVEWLVIYSKYVKPSLEKANADFAAAAAKLSKTPVPAAASKDAELAEAAAAFVAAAKALGIQPDAAIAAVTKAFHP